MLTLASQEGACLFACRARALTVGGLGICCPSPGWAEECSGQGGLHVVQSWNQALSSRQIRARDSTLVVEPPSELPKLSPTQISLRVQI